MNKNRKSRRKSNITEERNMLEKNKPLLKPSTPPKLTGAQKKLPPQSNKKELKSIHEKTMLDLRRAIHKSNKALGLKPRD